MRIATIGNFDGVHRGHRALIERAVALGRGLPGSSVVAVTFWPHPLRVLRPEVAPPILTGVERRTELLKEAGVDDVVVLAFTPELAATSPEDFAVLLRESPDISADVVVVGSNFRFGKGGAGTTLSLEEFGARLGFSVDVVPLVSAGSSDAWSSTLIRESIARGDVGGAQQGLGRPHRLDGVVIHGDHRGRELGYPTANLDIDPAMVVPADGVYAGWLIAEDHRYPAAISIGTNPQFQGRERRVEAHVLGREDLVLYGRSVSVEFHERLRGQEVFSSVEDLQAQMGRDVARANALVGPGTLGTDGSGAGALEFES